jgi:D-alanyl-D-alanine carboxypeptidase
MSFILPKHFEEKNLVEFIDGDATFKLHHSAMLAWKRMKEAARAEGIHLYIVSAFRSIARQLEIIEGKRKNGLSDEEIFRVSALPGFSEHHTGRALDLNTPEFPALEEEFEDSRAFQWLIQNAGQFGFELSYPRENKYGISYEPWHWFYKGNGKQDGGSDV